MPTPHLIDAPSSLYEQDFYAWTQQQAALLKAGHWGDIDVVHLIEEVESMGASERRELYSRFRVLLAHLLKWRYQPQQRAISWRATIRAQRYEIRLLLKQSPSLKRLLPDAVSISYPVAREDASDETGLPLTLFPEACPFTEEQALADDFWPDQGQERSSEIC